MPDTHDFPEPLRVCLVQDDRSGHRRQLRGLCSALEKHANLEVTIFDVTKAHTGKFSQQDTSPDYDRPINIVIGAGHATHKTLLSLAKKHHAFSCVLMSPSLPNCLFDAVIAPRHDRPRKSPRTFETIGPLHDLVPRDSTSKHRRLMLVGGPTKHFQWSSNEVLIYARHVKNALPKLPFTLICSPRTPDDFCNLASQAFPPNEVADADTRLEPWLHQAQEIWLTPDSSNMLHESLAMRVPIGIVPLRPKARVFRRNRLWEELLLLQQEQRVYLAPILQGISADTLSFEIPQPLKTDNDHQADLAAEWLLTRYQRWYRREH